MSQSNRILAIFAVIIVAVGGYFLFSSRTANAPQLSENVSTATPVATTKEFVLRIEDKKIVGGNSTLTVKQGDTVVLNITSDELEEFHIHGYDQSAELEPGVEATLTYTASASGRFPFELEKSKTELGAIEVLP